MCSGGYLLSMKDPAFLFYSSDFLTGTMLLNMEQKGKYITLLCLQHNKGRLTEKDMLSICGSYDADVFGKFTKDEEGYFLNERLSLEVQKRKAYSESRRNNRIKKDVSHISKTYVPHMENENENENKDVIKKTARKKFVKPDENDVYNLMGELNSKGGNFLTDDKLVNFARTFIDYYEAKGWVVGKSPMKDWSSAVRNWMRSEWDKVKNQKQNTYAKQSNSTADSINKAEQLFRDAVAISHARDSARQDSTTA